MDIARRWCWVFSASFIPKRTHFVEPSLASPGALQHRVVAFEGLERSIGNCSRPEPSDEVHPYRTNPAKLEDVTLETLEAVCAIVPAIEQPRHAHRDDDACCFSREQLLRHPPMSTLDRKTGPKCLFQERMEQRWKMTMPE